MRNQKINNIRWTIITCLVLSFFVVYFQLSLVNSVHAQESSPSGSLLDKLNQLKSEIASKAAQIKTEINQKVQNKAIIGQILSISSSEIIIQSLNSTKTIRVDEFTEVIGAKNKKIKLETLEESDSIAALGDMDDKNNLVAKRVVFMENFASNSASLVWGQVQKTTPPTITIKAQNGQSVNILTNAQTNFFLGNNEASIADSKVEKYLVARGTRLNDGSIRARFIYFIPSTGFTKPSEQKSNINIKLATPAASKKP